MDPQKIQDILKDVHFPITKEELLQEAEKKGAPDLKSYLQEKLPQQTFGSMEEVLSKIPFGQVGSMLGI